MEIIINGEKVLTEAANLSELVGEREINTNGVAIAVGSRIVRRDQWASTLLTENVTVTVIRATQGG